MWIQTSCLFLCLNNKRPQHGSPTPQQPCSSRLIPSDACQQSNGIYNLSRYHSFSGLNLVDVGCSSHSACISCTINLHLQGGRIQTLHRPAMELRIDVVCYVGRQIREHARECGGIVAPVSTTFTCSNARQNLKLMLDMGCQVGNMRCSSRVGYMQVHCSPTSSAYGEPSSEACRIQTCQSLAHVYSHKYKGCRRFSSYTSGQQSISFQAGISNTRMCCAHCSSAQATQNQ